MPDIDAKKLEELRALPRAGMGEDTELCSRLRVYALVEDIMSSERRDLENAATRIRSLSAQLEEARRERDEWQERESETQDALQAIGEDFGAHGGEPRTDAMRRLLTEAREESADKDDEIAMLRDSEARWIARLAVVREVSGDNGKMMLPDFVKWFNERWGALLASESEAAALREIIEDCSKALPNGAHVGRECSLDFMRRLPAEIAAVCARLISPEAAALRERVGEEREACARIVENFYIGPATSRAANYREKHVTRPVLAAEIRARTALEGRDV